MNKRLLHSRFYPLLGLLIILMAILCVRLFVLTIFQQEDWAEAASSQNTKEVTTSAPRGDILDRYGRTLAASKQVFTVTFNASGLTTDEINKSIYTLVKLLEENGDAENIVDNFPIEITKNEKFRFTYDRERKAWLEEQGFADDLTAEEAFEKLRIKYEIDPDLDRFDAMEELQDNYGIYPPIEIKSMVYTYDNSKASFLEMYGLDEDMNAREAFYALREMYGLDEPLFEEDEEPLSDAEVRKIFVIRQEIMNLGYNRYQSCTIATNISDETIAYVEEMGSEMKGVEISSETVRYYPNGTLASHVLGYMGSISDSEYETYVTENGYNVNDLIGKDGIERSMESVLRGTDGVQTIQIDSSGNYVSTISETEPQAGKNVYLTIDADLQAKAEEVLKDVIEAVQTGSKYKSEYGNVTAVQYENCESGATVVLDVKTGEVLAMASYPDYDPNIFAEGISTSDWASVQSTNPRDSLAPTPLYNIATRTAVQPGSTFKPITAIAALKAGLDPNMYIRDGGYIELGDRTYGCDSWNRYRGTHGYETLSLGIQNSCNYYFYCIATGINWNNNTSLGYSIEIEDILDVAASFGLGSETGIEIGESTTSLASAEKKMSQMKYSLWYALYDSASQYFPADIVSDSDALTENIDTITGWIEDNPSRADLIAMLASETDVKESKLEEVADLCKYSYFEQAQWGTGDAFNIAIGQGDNAYTPLQMARYIAALGNGGVLNTVTLIKGIEGEGNSSSVESTQIDVTEEELNEVLDGMRRVATNGTLAGLFANFPVAVAGKTGTAEKDGYIEPADEVAYVKEHLSQITSDVTWKQVQKQMTKLMEENPEKYPTEDDAVDDALIRASGDKITQSQINQFKDEYDNFAWTVTLAPVDDPQIVVVTLLIQGGTSANAAIVNRELTGAYLLTSDDYAELDLSTKMN